MNNLRIPVQDPGTGFRLVEPYPPQPDMTTYQIVAVVVFLAALISVFLIGYLLGMKRSKKTPVGQYEPRPIIK